MKLITISTLILFNHFILSNFNFKEDSLKPPFKFQTIIIDPGHGGKDPGARGSHSLEKNVALSISKKLKAAIVKDMPGIHVIMTRTTDKFVELKRRVAIANENHGNLFISIHCNSSPEGISASRYKRKGVMVLVYGFYRKQEQTEAIRENSSIYKEKNYKQKYKTFTDPSNAIMISTFLQRYRKHSISFASLLINGFRVHDKRTVLGVKEQGVLVLTQSAMPAVLVETGFINNPTEEKYLNSWTGQQQIVQTIVRSIKNYRKKVTVR